MIDYSCWINKLNREINDLEHKLLGHCGWTEEGIMINQYNLLVGYAGRNMDFKGEAERLLDYCFSYHGLLRRAYERIRERDE